jgi:hypothetical protein
MFKLRAKPEVGPPVRAFREARRSLDRHVKAGLVEAGEEVAVPAARVGVGNWAIAGRPVAGTLVARATLRGAYVTTTMRGTAGRAVGLLEFGGDVSTPIRPKKGRALVIAGRFVRAHVTKTRHYRPGLRITTAVEASQPRIAEVTERNVIRAFHEFNTSGTIQSIIRGLGR